MLSRTYNVVGDDVRGCLSSVSTRTMQRAVR